MVKKGSQTKTQKPRRRKSPPPLDEKQEALFRAATRHLVMKHGMFLVATDVREITVKGIVLWIFTVTLRFVTGHQGYIGDLLYDGEEFTFLTPEEVRKERSRQIANDPEGKRQWEEFRAASLRTGKT